MNYQKQYDKIISNAQQEDRKRNKEVYYENHHIIPRCLDGKDIKENLVFLTAKEHYVCHKLLTLIYPHHPGIAFAFHMMTYFRTKEAKSNYRLSSRDYEWARNHKQPGPILLGKRNGMYGVKRPKELLDKMAEGRRKRDKEDKLNKQIEAFFNPHTIIKSYKKTDEELFMEQESIRLKKESKRLEREEKKRIKQSIFRWDLKSKEYKEYAKGKQKLYWTEQRREQQREAQKSYPNQFIS